MPTAIDFDAHQQNRRSWNAVTEAHNSHKDDQAGFFRRGGSTLYPDEIELAGDVTGKQFLHLQCNCGQDTLSFASLGAIVTGVDISDDAIAVARQLSADSGIPGTFVRADLLEWFADAQPSSFDLVFASYGTIGWLSNLDAWAAGIARVLRPDGTFVFLEFHPTMTMFDENMVPKYSSTGGSADLNPEGIGDYVAMSGQALTVSGHLEGIVDFQNPHPVVEYAWGVGDVVTALLGAGLTLNVLREYPYSNGFAPSDQFRPIEGRRFTTPEGFPTIPMMYGIVATR